MPRYLALFTAERLTPPTPEHIARMGKFVEQQARAGRLVATGGLKRRDDGLTVRRKGDSYQVEDGGAPWAAATGYAILEAPSREALIGDVKEFLGLAGEGVSEIIEISDATPPR
jgi:hypothetical protein